MSVKHYKDQIPAVWRQIVLKADTYDTKTLEDLFKAAVLRKDEQGSLNIAEKLLRKSPEKAKEMQKYAQDNLFGKGISSKVAGIAQRLKGAPKAESNSSSLRLKRLPFVYGRKS